MSLDRQFSRAVACVSNQRLGKLPTPDLLKLYAWYKQATVGECHTDRPGWFDGAGRAKWDAWDALGAMDMDEAKQYYIDLVEARLPGATAEASLAASHDLLPPADAPPPVDASELSGGDGDGGGSDGGSGGGSGGAHGFSISVSTMRETDAGARPATGGHGAATPTDRSTLTACVQAGDRAATEALLAATTNALARTRMLEAPGDDPQAMTPLHWACDRADAEMAKLLLKTGANANAADANGQTPLHYAATLDSASCCLVLLSHGADPLAEDRDGAKPGDLAGDAEVVRLFATA